MYLRFPLSLRNVEWRAVDHEGEILESFDIWKCDKTAALTFLKKALKRHGRAEAIVTDGLRSYPAAMRDLGNLDRREIGRWKNNRVRPAVQSRDNRCSAPARQAVQRRSRLNLRV
jgi:transposase-like protein